MQIFTEGDDKRATKINTSLVPISFNQFADPWMAKKTCLNLRFVLNILRKKSGVYKKIAFISNVLIASDKNAIKKRHCTWIPFHLAVNVNFKSTFPIVKRGVC